MQVMSYVVREYYGAAGRQGATHQKFACVSCHSSPFLNTVSSNRLIFRLGKLRKIPLFGPTMR